MPQVISDTDNTTSNTTAGKFVAEFSQPKLRTWLVIITLSLLIPPLGLILALLFVFWGLKAHRRQLYLLALAAVASAIVGILAVYGVRTILYNHGTQPYKYVYHNLDDYKLSGRLEKTAISFKKPAEFKEADHHLEEGLSTVNLYHYYDQGDTKTALGSINATLSYSALASAKGYAEAVTKMMQTQGNGYDKFAESFDKYLKKTLPAGMTVKLGTPSPLSTANIQKNAWKFDFTARGKVNNYTNESVIKGEMVFLIGSKGFYNLVIHTVDYNWQPNKATWQQILDSIKINQ